MKPFSDIPKYCINLDRRLDRWLAVSEEFRKHEIYDVVRWPAVDARDVEVPEDSRKLIEHNASAILACAMSHLSVIREAKKQGHQEVCIFEDDIQLSDRFHDRMRYIESLDLSFDQLYLGGHGFTRQPYYNIPNIYRIKQCGGTYAYIIRHTVYDYVLNTWTYQSGMDEWFDYFLQKNYIALAHVPLLVGTQPNFSDVANHFADYQIPKV